MKVSETLLFRGIDAKNVREMLACLGGQVRRFQVAEEIYDYEEKDLRLGVVLSGRAVIERIDREGNRTVLEYFEPNDLFSNALSGQSARDEASLIAETPCEVLFLDYQSITKMCQHACERHAILIRNLLHLISVRTARLTRRVEILSARNIRDKLGAYFEEAAHGNLKRTYTLPFNLTQLADYICTDRSAMMRELKKLKEEGYLELNNGKLTLFKHFG